MTSFVSIPRLADASPGEMIGRYNGARRRKTSGFTVYLFRGELECEHQRSNLGLSRLHESAVFPRRRVPRMSRRSEVKSKA